MARSARGTNQYALSSGCHWCRGITKTNLRLNCASKERGLEKRVQFQFPLGVHISEDLTLSLKTWSRRPTSTCFFLFFIFFKRTLWHNRLSRNVLINFYHPCDTGHPNILMYNLASQLYCSRQERPAAAPHPPT